MENQKDELIMSLKVSGLRTALWNTHKFLYETGSADFQFNFGRELAEAIRAIDNLIYKCDNYLDNYVGNYKGVTNEKRH